MSVETYSIIIDASDDVLWSFIQNPENWLPLLPGYLTHQKLDSSRYQTKMHLALGPIDRDVELFFVTKPQPQNKNINFSFQSTTDKVTGYGTLNCQKQTQKKSLVQLTVDIKLSGKTGLLFRPALSKIKTSWSQETLKKMADLF